MGALTVISLLPFLLILPPAFKELFLGSNIGGIFHELIALSEIELHSSILVPFLLHITIEDELFASNLKFRHVLLVGHFGVRTGKIFIVRSLSSNLEPLTCPLRLSWSARSELNFLEASCAFFSFLLFAARSLRLKEFRKILLAVFKQCLLIREEFFVCCPFSLELLILCAQC